jgi:hypothetical protein
MSSRVLRSWAGLISIFWILGGYELLFNGTLIRHLLFLPTWFYLLAGLFAWLGVGLGFAIMGLKGGTLAGRLGGLLGAVIFTCFAWMIAAPALHWSHPIIGRERLNYGESLIYPGAPFCCIYVGLDTNEAPHFEKAFWHFADKHNLRKPNKHYIGYSGPGLATCHNDHVSLFVFSVSTDWIVSHHESYAQFEETQVSWQAGMWFDAYWPSNASRITKNGLDALAPLTGTLRIAPNDPAYPLQDFKQLCDALTNAIQSAFPDRAVRSFYYDGDKP